MVSFHFFFRNFFDLLLCSLSSPALAILLKASSVGPMRSSLPIMSLIIFPSLARCFPVIISYPGDSRLIRELEGGQALLAATPLFVTGQEATIGPLNVTLSATSGSIWIPPAVGRLPPSPVPQEPPSVDSMRPLVMGYYPDWEGASLSPEDINFSWYDWIDFAFGIPGNSFGVTWDSDSSPKALARLVTAAHKKDVKVKLSIGGWTGSKHFSTAVASSGNREIFAQKILDMYNKFQLDGIDIDWEYPGHDGAEGNDVNSSDSANFLLLLQHLRSILPVNARLTVAAQTAPFVDDSGQPMTDLSKFAEVLDWVLIMNYDVWTASSTPGSNAPMNDGCHNSSQPGANAVAAYEAWTSAGFPASKLVLGLPSYGYVSDSEASDLRSRSTKALKFRRLRSLDDGSEEPGTTIKIIGEDGSSTVQFRELLRQGALVRTSASAYDAAGGFTRHWDTCTSTPWLRSEPVKQIITYDDPESLYMKAEFAKKVGMLGVNMFDIHGDTDEWDLIQAVRRGLAAG